uniref:NBS-LRR protein n=1 Tax=Malus domestica TaxID=3750 RepID=T2C629_MALDO|nr:NBS-LRR protein [Malus domestica]
MTAHEASSSSSSKSKLWSYDVFLSFRGEDTRNGFTSHLHEALKNRGYHVFIDEDGLKRGEEIKEKLFRAIEESRISIIVFSRRYADSSWCLDELVKIMECRGKLGHVLPIFYHVDPSHVRKQDGDLAEAFQKHETDICEEKDDEKRKAKQERVKQWREALTEAANLSGHHLQSANNRKRRREGHTEDTNLSDHQTTGNGCEAEFIKKIVDENIWEWLPRTNELHVARHPIGIKSRIQGIISDLSSGGSNDVLMVGIWGMGGLGKTTAAKAIYNQIHHMFEFKSFLADVSDTSSKHGLVYLQETLISDILKQKSQIRNVDLGINMIQQVVKHRRVLIIIDNIDDRKQLEAIAQSHDWFGPGSRIIMTTRNEHLLKKVEVDKTYPLREMKKEEALELFSWHAFQKSCPNEEYLEVSKKVVSYCGGLPLALEVLGSLLLKRPIIEWKRQLEKLERIPEGEIIKPLRISFEGLDDTEKATFLDISCFFIGKEKDYVAKILDGCGFYATLGISILRERCLVTVEYNRLKMHDLIREMARVIISEKSLDRPGKWSRLWNRQEVTDVLTNKSGTGKIEGLALECPPDPLFSFFGFSTKAASFSTEAFANMKKLRLLELNYVELKGEYKHLPKELIWLCWEGFPLQSIPDDFFNQDKLVVLEMHGSDLVQVWEGSKSLRNLKTLDLCCSSSLQKPPDFSQVPNLEELILEGCSSLFEIHPSIGYLKRLSLVNLNGCYSLSSLPRDFYRSKSVETLLLNRCTKFRELHEDVGEMISLRTLEAKDTAIREVPHSIGHLKRLSLVNLTRCWELRSLPRDFYKSKSVETLLLNRCTKFIELHEDIGEMISLRTLEAMFTAIREVPPSIVRLKNLTRLSLDCISVELKGEYKYLCWKRCPLKSIPGDFFNQDRLVVLEMPQSKLVQVWEGSKSLHNLKTLDLSYSYSLQKSPDFSQVPNLEELILEWCSSLSEIHPSIGHLKRLSLVNLNGCYSLSSLPRDFYKSKSVETLLLNRCTKFRELHKDIGEMISLRTLEAEDTAIREVPPSIVGLKNLTRLSGVGSIKLDRISVKHTAKELIRLRWKGCPLKSIPGDFFNQDRLVVLEMPQSKLVQVWEGSKSLHNLKTLDLSGSWSLQKSLDFSQVPNLEELILEGCESLFEIHPSIGHLKRLSLVNLGECDKLISLPRDFFKSKSVETLLLNYCSEFIELHEDIGEMKSLRTLEAMFTAIREVPPSIGHLKRLSLVNLTGCDNLISLPRDFYKLKSIETLLLNGCLEFIELHEDIWEMISLRTLEAKDTAIKEVPHSIVRLQNLTRLYLDKYCLSIELKGEYKYLCWDLCPLKFIPDDSFILDFFNQDQLVRLKMHGSQLVQVWEGSKVQ